MVPVRQRGEAFEEDKNTSLCGIQIVLFEDVEKNWEYIPVGYVDCEGSGRLPVWGYSYSGAIYCGPIQAPILLRRHGDGKAEKGL